MTEPSHSRRDRSSRPATKTPSSWPEPPAPEPQRRPTSFEVVTRWVETYKINMAVVTLGAGGAVALRQGGEEVRVPGFSTDVVDTIGAGDTFMAGLLDGYIHWRQNLSDALHRGAAAASIVCSRQGVQPPTAAEVDQMLNATTAAPTC